MIFFPKDHKFYNSSGEYMAKTSRDIYYSDQVRLDDFTDWQIPVPEVHSSVPDWLDSAINQRRKEISHKYFGDYIPL